MAEQNPYESPIARVNADATTSSVLVRLLSAYGVFCCMWFGTTVLLYFFVFGDNSSTFGLYGIAPAAIIAVIVFFWLRHRKRASNVIAVVTLPGSLMFTYKLIWFGV